MKEYQYMLMAIEEYLSHYNSMAICAENYSGLNFPNAFDEFFDKFINISNKYNISNLNDKDEIVFAVKYEFRREREADFKLFMESISKMESVIKNAVNLDEIIKDYMHTIDSLKGVTLEDRLLLYPYIINKIRKSEEKSDVR